MAYWSFDRDFTATLGGPAFNGIPVNGASIDTSRSRFGGASLRLRRGNHQYIRVQQSPFVQQSYTYAAWYYLDVSVITGANRYMLLEASDGNSWPASYGLRLNGTEQAGNVFTDDNGTIGSTPSVFFPSKSHRAWRHIAVTYDAETFRLEAFLDGAGAGMLLLRPDATMLSASSYLNIGSHREPTGRNWEGWIDEVAVWDRVLSQEEIGLLQDLPPALLENHGLAGYEKWIAGFELPDALRDPEAIVGGDGMTNLEKYAFGLDPRQTVKQGDRPVLLLENGGGGDRLILEIPRNPDAVGLEVWVEASRDLSDWRRAETVVLKNDADLLRVEVWNREGEGEPE